MLAGDEHVRRAVPGFTVGLASRKPIARINPRRTRPALRSHAPVDPRLEPTNILPAWPFLAPPQAPDELGRLGPYRVLRQLGQGGMGVVFQAEDPQLRRPVALKVMRPDFALRDDARARFLREARAAAALRHDN